MKFTLKSALLILVLFFSHTVLADTKIGYVAIEKIMQSSISTDVGKKLQKEFSPRQEDVIRLKKQIEDRELSLSSKQANSSDQKELDDLKLDFARKQRELAEDFDLRKNEERQKLQVRVNDAVTSIAQSEGYDLILYGNAAYFGKTVDITDKVLKNIK